VKHTFIPAALLLLAAGLARPQDNNTPVTVGDGSVRIGPASILHKNQREWDDLGAGIKRQKRNAQNRIVSMQAAGTGAISTAAVPCPVKTNCTLTVVYQNGADFAVVTLSSERSGLGVVLSSSIPWDDFDWNGADGVASGAFRVVWAGVATGGTQRRLCRDTGSSNSCRVTVNFR
jgi:hypothetical protein